MVKEKGDERIPDMKGLERVMLRSMYSRSPASWQPIFSLPFGTGFRRHILDAEAYRQKHNLPQPDTSCLLCPGKILALDRFFNQTSLHAFQYVFILLDVFFIPESFLKNQIAGSCLS